MTVPSWQADDAFLVEDGDTRTVDVADWEGADAAGLKIVAIDADGADGTIVQTGETTLVFDPGDAFQHLQDGVEATDSFSITVEDEAGTISTVEMIATVTGVNYAPTADEKTVADAIVESDGPREINITANDVDHDNETLELIVGDQPALGSVSVNEAGKLVFDPGEDFQDLPEGETEKVTFTYTAADPAGAVSEPAEVTLTVQGVAEAPEGDDTTLPDAFSKAAEQTGQFDGFGSEFGSVHAIAVDGDGNVYVGGYVYPDGPWSSKVRKFDAEGDQVWEFDEHGGGIVSAVALGDDGTVYSGGGDGGTVRKIDPDDGTELWSFGGHDSMVWAVAVDDDGTVYSGSPDGTVRKIDPDDGSEVWEFNGHDDYVHAVAVGDDGTVYSGGWDGDNGTVRKIDPDDGSQIWQFDGHDGGVYAVAVGDDGAVYAGGWDGTVRKIDPDDGSEIWQFDGHDRSVRAVAVGDDGYVYSGSIDGTVRKIDPDDGTEIWQFDRHDGPVYAVAVGDDGTVYSGGRYGTVRKIETVYAELEVSGIAIADADTDEPIETPAPGDTLTVTATLTNTGSAATNELTATLTLAGDEIDVTADATLDAPLGSGESTEVAFSVTIPEDAPEGAISLTVTADADNAARVSTAETVTVEPSNQPPTADDKVIDVPWIESDGPREITVAVSDVDHDAETLTLTVVEPPTKGSVSVNEAGTLVFDPGEDFTHLQEGETEEVTFTYTAEDPAGAASEPATVTLTVQGVNYAPEVQENVTAAFVENTGQQVIDIAVSDIDNDPDAFTYTVFDLPPGKGTAEFNESGQLVFAPGDDFQYLQEGEDETVTFKYSVDDGAGGVSEGNVTLTVQGVNDDPVVATNHPVDVVFGEAVTITADDFKATDVDNPPEGIVFTVETLPAYGALLFDGAPMAKDDFFTQADVNVGEVTFDPGEDPRVTQSPATIGLALSDDAGGSAGTVAITINAALPEGDETVLAGDGDLVADPTGNGIVIGGDGGNTISGSYNGNQIASGSGDDTIVTGGGDNLVIVDGGNNNVHGSWGQDTIKTGNGDDTITVGGGAENTVETTGGNNTITGNWGRDTIRTGDGNDVITVGGGAENTVETTGGNNTISGNWGRDTIKTGNGNDTIHLNGGAENTVETTGGNNTIYGSWGSDTITTGDGDDTIHGGGGNDVMTATGGNNEFFGSWGNDTMTGGMGNDVMRGNGGHDTFHGTSGNNEMHGGWGDDTFHAGSGNDVMYGGGGQNTYWFGDEAGGANEIHGFDAQAKLKFGAGSSVTADSWADAISAEGNDTHIDLGDGAVVVLRNTRPEDLSEDNFAFA